MKSLVTGATGFVGSAVVRVLLNAGREVRVIVRPTSRRENLGDLDVEVCEGDLTDPTSLRAALNGCDQLFHVAADYRLWARDPQEIYRSNVDGTINIMDAARDAGIQKIVYTSSVATLGLTSDRSAADEDTPTSIEQMIGAYKRSKYLAEQEVIKRSRESGTAGGDRQSVRAGRAARPQTDTDRPADSRCGGRAHARPMSIPGSISCMSMTSPRATC